MSTCQTSQWGNSSPYVRLTVTQSSQDSATVTLSWKLQYYCLPGYPAQTNGVGREYVVKIDGSTVKTGAYNINGKTGWCDIASDTKKVNKSKSARNVTFSVSFGFNLTWSGIKKTTLSASGSIAISAKPSYTVTYNANGGTGAPSKQTKWYGEALPLSSTEPTRTGHAFKGWATSSTGSVVYSAGGSYTKNAAVTLYAVWSINSYTVTYNANGGTGAPSSVTKFYGTDIKISSEKPTRTGYNFVCWNTKKDRSGTDYAPGANYSSNAAATLYAVWSRITYQVTYNANGGTGAPSKQTKQYGIDLELSSAEPSRPKYNFKGWSTSKTGSVAYNSGAKYTKNAALTLYAVWELAYTVPRITKLSADRCDESENLTDEGEFAIVEFDWSCVEEVSQIKISWRLLNSTESEHDQTVPSSGKSGHIRCKIGSTYPITVEDTCLISVSVVDAGGSNSVSTLVDGTVFPLEILSDFSGVYMPRDVKGSVLGLNRLIDIPDNSDFNSYTKPGVYSVALNTSAETMNNMPTQKAGRLIVADAIGCADRGSYDYRRQTFIPYLVSLPVYERFLRKNPSGDWYIEDWKVSVYPTKDIAFTPVSGASINRYTLARNGDVVTFYLMLKLNSDVSANSNKQIGTIASDYPALSVATVGLQNNSLCACWVRNDGSVWFRPSAAYAANVSIEFSLTWNVSAAWTSA